MKNQKLILLVFVGLFLALAGTNITKGADPDLLGWWKLDDGEGTIALDSSGNENHGTINNPSGGLGLDGSVWDIDPNRGSVLSFNGDDTNGAYVSASTTTPMTLSNNFTWAFWAKQDVAQGNNDDVIIGNRWNGSSWIKFTPSFFEFGSNSLDSAINYDNLPSETWVHHAVVKNRTQYTYYRDGINAGEANINRTCDALPFLMGGDTDGERWRGRLSHVRIYKRALSETEIQIIIRGEPELSWQPNPPNGATDVPRDNFVLSWTPGRFADKHDVYIGTIFDDVKNAGRNNPLGVLLSLAQDTKKYEPGRLEFDQTYYWRVDEVNAPPELIIYKGDIWSFTTESLAYPIPGINIIATASSQIEDQGPENTVNGSGMDMNGLHSNSTSAMWLSDSSDLGPVWIQYEFDKLYKLHEMQVWNYNGQLFLSGFGFKDVSVEYSDNGADWMSLGNVTQFARATGTNEYAANTVVDFNDLDIRAVKITANSNWGGALFKQYGLSEVSFLQIPVYAHKPEPENGATDVAHNVTLSWRVAREAAEHKVYLSTDRQAVLDDTAPVVTVSQAMYGPISLELAKTYYWRIDEVNDVETPSLRQGDIWSFTTSESIVADDFESYNDIEAGQAGSNLVYLTWIDGYDNPSTNGSTIGYLSGSSMETMIVHGGRQSVPFSYNNTTASYSQATADTTSLAIGPDWTVGAPEKLMIWVYGDPNNSTTDRMYAKVNNAKVLYDGDLTQMDWQEFSIDLAALGIDLSNITQMAIGFERTGATGGSGIVFIDDIMLYSPLQLK
jgi:hypothetical protein